MKKLSCALLLLLALILPARAAELPRELENALPQEAEELLRGDSFDSAADLSAGIGGIFNSLKEDAGRILRQRAQSAILILLVVLLCGAVDGLYQGAGGRTAASFLPMAGALSVTLLAAGSLDSLIGLGAETIERLHTFSKFLLPTLAAAVAAGGAVGTATVQQVATVFFVDLLLQLINGLLLPLVYHHVGMASKALNRIADTLQQWEKALVAVPALLGERVDGDPTPQVLLAAIAEVRRRDSWQALAPLRARIFPANLIAKPAA